MLTFLKFVGAVVLVVIVLIVLSFYWLKRKIGKVVATAAAAMQLPMPSNARVSLRHESADDADEHVQSKMSLQSELQNAGFTPLGRYCSDDGIAVTAWNDAQSQVAAALVEINGDQLHCEYYAIGTDGRNAVLTTEPGAEALELRSLSVRPLRDLTPRQAVATLTSAPKPLRTVDSAMFVLFFERLFATRMDQHLRTPPTIDALLRLAAARGKSPTLTGAEQSAAVKMATNIWLSSVETAVKDNARRQLRIASDAWSRIDADLRVVHAHLDADQAIEVHHGDDLITRLGEQLKQQNLTPLQIFDEINRRRPLDAQLVPIAQVGMPIAATIYAAGAAMRSIGLGSNTLQGSAA